MPIHPSRSHVTNVIEGRVYEVLQEEDPSGGSEQEDKEGSDEESGGGESSSNSNTTSPEEEVAVHQDNLVGGYAGTFSLRDLGRSTTEEARAATKERLEEEGIADELSTDYLQKMNDAFGIAATKVSDFKSKVNDFLSMPTREEMMNKLKNKFPNLNMKKVAKALSIFDTIFCGDSNSLLYGLKNLIGTLDFDFGFLATWNICGRKRLRNPLEIYTKTLQDIEDMVNYIGNTLPRLWGSLKNAVEGFILRNGLPSDLVKCLHNKAVDDAVKKLSFNVSLEEAKKLADFFNGKICSKSEKGLAGDNNKTVNKIVATPFITGMADYDDKSRLSTSLTFFEKESNLNISDHFQILAPNLLDESKKDKVVATLEVLAVALNKKPVEESFIPEVPNLGDMQGLHNYIQNASKEQIQEIKDKIINGAVDEEDGNLLCPPDADNSSYDMMALQTLDICLILKNMEDDRTGVPNPVTEFVNILNMLYNVNRNFSAADSIDMLSTSKTLKDLAKKIVSSASPNTSVVRTVILDEIEYHQVPLDESISTDVYLMSETMSKCSCGCGGMCGCDGLLFV